MSEHVWEVGDWGREHGYIIRYVGMQDGLLKFRWPDGSTGRRSSDSVIEYLPDCTGFDWQPTAEHVWEWGDWGRTRNGTIVRFVSVWDGGDIFVGATGAVNCLRDVAYLPDCTDWDWKPIEPQYRPFANGAEYAPHRERWIRSKDKSKSSRCRIIEYDDTRIWVFGQLGLSYAEAFKLREFERGEPFGVEDK